MLNKYFDIHIASYPVLVLVALLAIIIKTPLLAQVPTSTKWTTVVGDTSTANNNNGYEVIIDDISGTSGNGGNTWNPQETIKTQNTTFESSFNAIVEYFNKSNAVKSGEGCPKENTNIRNEKRSIFIRDSSGKNIKVDYNVPKFKVGDDLSKAKGERIDGPKDLASEF